MPGHPGRRRGTGPAGPACCVALALLLHGLLLAPRWRDEPRQLEGGLRHRDAVARVRLLPPAPVIGPVQAPAPAAVEEPRPRRPHESAPPSAAPDQDLWQPLPEGQVLIQFPDAPLPGTRLALRVLLVVDADGHPLDISSNAGPAVAEAFVEAVQRGLRGVVFGPAQRGGHALPAALCLSVVFDAQQPQAAVQLNTAGLRDPSRCLAVPASIEP